MRILHILDHSLPTISGYSIRTRNIVHFQREIGLRPVVLTSPRHPDPAAPRELLDGIPHYRTVGAARPDGALPYLRELALMVRLARRIGEVARAEGASIIHAHSPVLNGLPALWVGHRLGLPVVYEARGFWEDSAVDHGTMRAGSFRYRLSRALESMFFRQADRVVVIGHAMKGEVVLRGLDAPSIVVVPNGVDTDQFAPLARDERLARHLGLDGGPVLGFVGSFNHYEGLSLLVEALPDLQRRAPGVQLLLVGGGREEQALRSLASRLRASVVFPGRIPHERIRDYYSLIDIFVCPRRRMRLTELVTPLKPLEAMAMARAVLASDVGGQTELIRHRETGFLFPAGSRDALVEAAAELGTRPEMRAALGTRARQAVMEERAWPRVIPRYLDVYRGLA